VDELRQPGHDHGEDLLHHVVDVVGLRDVAAHPGADQRRVQLDEPPPARGVVPLAHPL
jgi:hypothetical protein